MSNKAKKYRNQVNRHRQLNERRGIPTDSGTRIDPGDSGSVDQGALLLEKLIDGSLPVRKVEQILTEAVDEGNSQFIRLAAQAMIDLKQADDELYAISAVSAMNCMLPQIALKHARIATRSRLNGPMVSKVRQLMPDLERFSDKMQPRGELIRLYNREQLDEAAYWNDRVMELMALQQYGAARRRVQRAIASYPLYLPLLNNSVRMAMQFGDYDAALVTSQTAMEHYPDDPFAIGNQILLQWITGESHQGKDHTGKDLDADAKLASVGPIEEDRREGLSYLMEVAYKVNLPERLIALWESSAIRQDDISPAVFAQDARLVAWAYGRTNSPGKALAVLKRVNPSDKTEVHDEMRKDLNLPFKQRQSISPLSSALWLPEAISRSMAAANASGDTASGDAASGDTDSGDTDAGGQYCEILMALIRKYPRVAAGVLDRGPMPARRAFLQAFHDTKSLSDELLGLLQAFAEGTSAPLADRLVARFACAKHGRATTRLWAGGWMSEEFTRIELHSESRKPDSTSDEVNAMSIELFSLLGRHDGKAAERLCRKILAIDPLRTTRNSLITSVQMQGRDEEADPLIESLYQDHPDYWFAKLQWVVYLLRRNRLDEAKSILDAMPQDIERWRTSEANGYGQARHLFAEIEGRTDDAYQFGQWNQACGEFERARLANAGLET